MTCRSKFLLCLDILRALNDCPSLDSFQIMEKASINSINVEKLISFLLQEHLIKEHSSSEGLIVYSISVSGRKVLRYFGEDLADFSFTNKNGNP